MAIVIIMIIMESVIIMIICHQICSWSAEKLTNRMSGSAFKLTLRDLGDCASLKASELYFYLNSMGGQSLRCYIFIFSLTQPHQEKLESEFALVEKLAGKSMCSKAINGWVGINAPLL